jgi:hypothetical protein
MIRCSRATRWLPKDGTYDTINRLCSLMHKQGSTTIARYDYTYNGQPRPMKMKWNGRSERHRYHVARQRGTIAETSREKVSLSITALLVNVEC